MGKERGKKGLATLFSTPARAFLLGRFLFWQVLLCCTAHLGAQAQVGSLVATPEQELPPTNPIAGAISASLGTNNATLNCWGGNGLLPIPEVQGLYLPDQFRTFTTGCPEDVNMTLVVHKPETVGPQIYDAFQVQGDDPLGVSVSGKAPELPLPSNETACFVVFQLCAVGIGTVCSPLIPSLDYIDSDHDSNFPYPVNSLVAYRRVTPDDHGYYEENLGVSGTPLGAYSIVISFVTIGIVDLQILGSSVIPTLPSEQLVIFSYAPETPASVDHWAVLLVVALSALGGILLLFLWIQLLRQRRTQVFQLSQGKFLVVMLFFGMLATSSLILYNPKNDLYCKLMQPMITMPLHFMYAILLGRMWRIRAIISPLLLLTLEKKEDWTQKCINLVERLTSCGGRRGKDESGEDTNSKRIRRSITDMQLTRVIVLLCLPQVVVQILILSIQDQHVHVDYDTEGYRYEGIEACKFGYFDNALGILSFCLVCGLFLSLLILARASRDLPSLFNETQSILDVAWVAVGMLTAGAMVILATVSSDAGVTVSFLAWTSLCGVTTVYTCVKITWPKLVVAWSGNKVIVSRLIADHNFRNKQSLEQQDDERSYGKSDTPNFQTEALPEVLGINTLSPGMDAGVNTNFMGSIMPPIDPSSSRKSDPFGADDDDDDSFAESDEHEQDEARSSASSVILIEEDTQDTFPVNGNENGVEEFNSQNSFHPPNATPPTMVHTKPAPDGRKGPSRLLSKSTLFRSTRTLVFGTMHQNSENSVCAPPPPPLRGNIKSMGAIDESNKTKSKVLRSNRASMGHGSEADTSRSHWVSGSQGPQPTGIEYNPKRVSSTIDVSEHEPPPRRLLLRMIDVQRMLAKVNQAILTGRSVNREDWEEIRAACVALGDAFTGEVLFEWEKNLVAPSRGVDGHPCSPPQLGQQATETLANTSPRLRRRKDGRAKSIIPNASSPLPPSSASDAGRQSMIQFPSL